MPSSRWTLTALCDPTPGYSKTASIPVGVSPASRRAATQASTTSGRVSTPSSRWTEEYPMPTHGRPAARGLPGATHAAPARCEAAGLNWGTA